MQYYLVFMLTVWHIVLEAQEYKLGEGDKDGGKDKHKGPNLSMNLPHLNPMTNNLNLKET